MRRQTKTYIQLVMKMNEGQPRAWSVPKLLFLIFDCRLHLLHPLYIKVLSHDEMRFGYDLGRELKRWYGQIDSTK